MNTLIEKSIKICGSQTALAKAIDARQQDVWNWLNEKYSVTPKYASRIEVATGGKVTAHQFHPDIFPQTQQSA